MKKVRHFYFKNLNSIIILILSVLGFSSVISSCESDNGGNNVSEYGTPYATYKVKGNVEAKDSSEPIENIKVVFANNDSTYTDKDGNYEISVTGLLVIPSITYNDIDGDQNGKYSSLDTVADFSSAKFSGGEGWFMGSTEKTLDIKLDTDE